MKERFINLREFINRPNTFKFFTKLLKMMASVAADSGRHDDLSAMI